MSNLIDANELYIRIREQVKSPAIVGCLGGIIAEVPTFGLDDLRPKGRWIGTGYDGYADGCLVYDLWECSECRAEFGCVGDPPPYEFCPSCGADMRGGDTR